MNTVIHVPDVFGYEAAKIDTLLNTGDDPFPVYFDYGTRVEMNKKLIERESGISSKGKKYPLIWLLTPFKEVHDDGSGYYCSLPDVSLFLVEYSDSSSTSQERKLKTFVPRLYPMYKALVNGFEASPYFDVGMMKHEKTDFPYYDGRDGKNQDANLFGDYLDVIQVNIKNLNVNETVCDRFKLIGA